MLTRRKPGKKISEKLTFKAIDFKTFQVKRLLVLPAQIERKMIWLPDGLELLLDRVVAQKTEAVKGDLRTDLRTDGGSAIAESSWMLLSLKKTSKSHGNPSPQPP